MKKKKKLNKDNLNIINSLTDNQKKEYLIKSKLLFTTLFVSIIIIGLLLTFDYINSVYILKLSSGVYTWYAPLIPPIALFELIRYFYKSKEEKIIDYYKMINIERTKNTKQKTYVWIAILILILVSVVYPIVRLFIGTGYKPVLILIAISGLYLCGFLWYFLLKKRKSK